MSRPGRPTDLLHGLRASTADLLAGLADLHWTDADARADSLLPDWTRGHVLTHLARNADGVAGTLAASLRHEVVEQYPGGREQRRRDIEAGAHRHLTALVADVSESAAKLDRVLGALDEAEAWQRPAGLGLPAHEWLRKRWLEVETHRVDLGCGYTPDRWPPLFIATVLPLITPSLAERAPRPLRVSIDPAGSVSASEGFWGTDGTEVRGPDWAVLAWLLGRTSTVSSALAGVPELAPWH